MKGCPGKTVVSMALLFTLLVTLLPACYSPAKLITAELSFSESPALGKAIQLTATFKLAELLKRRQSYAPEVTARIVLPEGFEKVAGDLEWKGDMKPGQRQGLVATVKAVRAGDWEVLARADFFPTKNEHYVANATLYVSVTETGASVSRDPPEPPMSKVRVVPPPGATPPPTRKPRPAATTPAANSQSLPLKARLSFSEPPALGKPVDLTATFTLKERFYRDARGVTGRMTLPVGFERVGGNLEWKGDLKRGESRTLSARVKAVKTGEWEIAARGEFMSNPGEYYVGTSTLYVSAAQGGAAVSDRPPVDESRARARRLAPPPDALLPKLKRDRTVAAQGAAAGLSIATTYLPYGEVGAPYSQGLVAAGGVNWLLTKEGQSVYARGAGGPSRRIDASTEGVPPIFIPQPGEMLRSDTPELTLSRPKLREAIKEILTKAGK